MITVWKINLLGRLGELVRLGPNLRLATGDGIIP